MQSLKLVLEASATEDLSRLTRQTYNAVWSHIGRILTADNPRNFGKAIKHHKGLWRYRVGILRVIARLEETAVIILRVGHRAKIYKALGRQASHGQSH